MKYKNETINELVEYEEYLDKKYNIKCAKMLLLVGSTCFITAITIGSVIPILSMPVGFLIGSQVIIYDLRKESFFKWKADNE